MSAARKKDKGAGFPRNDPPDKPVVFVSSTYLDNVERRGWVREAIERAGMVPLAMERWTASPLGPRELCVHRVQEADVFVGILAWRYGWIPDGEQKSITELEYDEAVRLEVPRLMFYVDQRLEDVNVVTEFDTDDRWGRQKLLDAFKARAKSQQTAMPFKDAGLMTLVIQSLFEWKEKRAAERGLPPSPNPAPVDPLELHAPTLAEYRQSVEAEHAQITLPGFEARLRVPLLLEDLYVPVDLASWEGGAERQPTATEEEERGDETESLNLASALQRLSEDRRQKGLVVLGHPGSGKTTQLRRLALSAVRGQLAEHGLPPDCVPVFIPLRKLVPADASLGDLVRRLVGDGDLGFDGGFARWLWGRGCLLLLVDGLDEVAKDRRAEVREWIETVARGKKGNVVVATCRFEGYSGTARFGPELTALSLRPLTDEQADSFVRRWHEAVALGLLLPEANAREKATAKTRAVETAEELVRCLHAPSMRAARVYELAHNPLLLTALCLVHRDRARLPERAAELYKETVDVLLQHWREAKRLPVSFESRTARHVLQRVALWLHEEEGRTQGSEEDLCALLQPLLGEAGWRDLNPHAFLATVRDESGLLTGWSAERFGFLHLGFQEYLTAHELYRLLRSHPGDVAAFQCEIDAIARRFDSSWWREVLCLLFAIDEDGVLFKPLFRAFLRHPRLVNHADLARQCAADAQRFDTAPFRELLSLPAGEGLWANRRVAAELLLSRGRPEIAPQELASALEQIDRRPGRSTEVQADQLLALQIVARLAPAQVIARGAALAMHPHPEVRALAATLVSAAVEVPAIEAKAPTFKVGGEWGVPRVEFPDVVLLHEPRGCELALIPGGRFLMGAGANEGSRSSPEYPRHTVVLQAFYLAVTPVTNEQYARFLAANPPASPPKYWGDRSYNQPRQPVVGVSWDEARAFCTWAGLELPTEAQWEYACRAKTQTRFWSGSSEADLDRVGWYGGNSDKHLHPVGEKPANPWGLFDMHGNVWEWCQDSYGSYELPVRAGGGERIVPEVAPSHVIRGGSFGDIAKSARSASRLGAGPGFRFGFLGFRPAMCIAPP